MVLQVQKNASSLVPDPADNVGTISREQLMSYLEHADFANKLIHQDHGLSVAIEVQSDDKPVFRGQGKRSVVCDR
jgi:hypothetical protein